MRAVIINTCLTGMVPTKELTPFVPISTDEIVNSALQCSKLGSTIVHLHPRDEDGKPTWKKEKFAEIIGRIREKNNKILISATTSGRFWKDFERRSECLELKGDLKPDMASLTVGSMNFIKDESMNSPQMIEDLSKKMMDNGIKPEFEIFEPGMLHKAKYLLQKEIVKDDAPYFNLLFGSLGTSPLEPSTFAAFHALLPHNALWSIAGIGNYQLDANVLGLSLGGHIRVGLEDNIYFDRAKKRLASNEMLVERMVKIIESMDLTVATFEETKELLKLN